MAHTAGYHAGRNSGLLVAAQVCVTVSCRPMTGWADTAVSELLGGVSQVVGTPFPADLDFAGPISSPDQLTVAQRVWLTYLGVDCDKAPLSQINDMLARGLPPSSAGSSPGSPPTPLPTDTATGPPDGMTGAAADAVKQIDAALAKNRSAINDADQQLSDAILKASTASAEGKRQLQALQQQIIDQVTKLGTTLDTPAGQQELAEFLQGKTADIISVLKNAGLDSQSQAAVLDALAGRYAALGKNGDGKTDEKPGGTTTPDNPGQPQAPGQPGQRGQTPGQPGTGVDPLLGGGLPSDPFMAGLGALPAAMGALGSLPAALGSMIPMGLGGGVPLGDLGSSLGGALHEPVHEASDEHEHVEPLKDHPDQPGGQENKPEPAPAAQQQPPTGQAAGAGGTVSPPAAAGSGQQQQQPSTAVTLPDNTIRVASSPALAQAGRDVLAGQSIDDAFQKAGLQLPPMGAPVTPALSPSRLEFGDIGQYTDHRVMALSKNDVWVNGQVTPIDQLETGPNFLGWTRVPATTPSATTPVATPPQATN